MQPHCYDDELGPPQQFNFTFRGREYVLREASADAGRVWRNSTTAGATMKDERITMPDTLADGESVLVAGCLFEVIDGKERQVLLSQVRALPDKLVADLFKRAKSMSGLDRKADKDAEKNSSSGGTLTSP